MSNRMAGKVARVHGGAVKAAEHISSATGEADGKAPIFGARGSTAEP